MVKNVSFNIASNDVLILISIGFSKYAVIKGARWRPFKKNRFGGQNRLQIRASINMKGRTRKQEKKLKFSTEIILDLII